MKLEFDLNEDPGRGSLNLRAYFASIVGPKRLAHAKRIVKQVPRDRGILLARNQAGNGAKSALFVACRPAFNLLGETGGVPPVPTPLTFTAMRFSSDENMGQNAAYTQVQPIGVNFGDFQAVLLPNEELYGQWAPDGIFGLLDPATPTFPLLVLSEAF